MDNGTLCGIVLVKHKDITNEVKEITNVSIKERNWYWHKYHINLGFKKVWVSTKTKKQKYLAYLFCSALYCKTGLFLLIKNDQFCLKFHANIF